MAYLTQKSSTNIVTSEIQWQSEKAREKLIANNFFVLSKNYSNRMNSSRLYGINLDSPSQQKFNQ